MQERKLGTENILKYKKMCVYIYMYTKIQKNKHAKQKYTQIQTKNYNDT